MSERKYMVIVGSTLASADLDDAGLPSRKVLNGDCRVSLTRGLSGGPSTVPVLCEAVWGTEDEIVEYFRQRLRTAVERWDSSPFTDNSADPPVGSTPKATPNPFEVIIRAPLPVAPVSCFIAYPIFIDNRRKISVDGNEYIVAEKTK